MSEVRLAIDHDNYGLRGLLDSAIRESAPPAGFRRFVQLAMRCMDESAAARPAMGEVVKGDRGHAAERSGADGQLRGLVGQRVRLRAAARACTPTATPRSREGRTGTTGPSTCPTSRSSPSRKFWGVLASHCNNPRPFFLLQLVDEIVDFYVMCISIGLLVQFFLPCYSP